MASQRNETDRSPAPPIHGFWSFIPAGLREVVGAFTGLLLIFAVPAAVVLCVLILYHAMQKAKVPEVACWHMQTVEGRLFKFNTCTGELAEVKAVPAAQREDQKK
jgi:hypothetical protein